MLVAYMLHVFPLFNISVDSPNYESYEKAIYINLEKLFRQLKKGKSMWRWWFIDTSMCFPSLTCHNDVSTEIPFFHKKTFGKV